MLALSTSKKFYDKYEFKIDDYVIDEEFEDKFDKSSYGCIHIVRNINNLDQKYVAKINIPKDEQYKHYISREINILVRIQHETIVPFLGFSYKDFDNNDYLTILMEYMENGSLANFIQNGIHDKSLEFTPTIRQIILIGIARGMMLLHKLNVIHRDLKPANILLDSKLHPHITDFGLSKFFDKYKPNEQTRSNLGTLYYMAPEVMEDSIFDIKADVYSFGIIMYEIVTGKSAFGHLGKISGFNFSKKIIEGVRPLIKKGTIKQKGLRVMMKMCWDKNPSKRPSFSEIFKKLSLSTNDFLLGFENNPEKEIINVNEKDSEDDQAEIEFEERKIEDMKKKGKNIRFCLDDVDYDQVSQYVDEVLDEPKNIHDEEMKDLKKEINEITKSQATLIEQLEMSKKQIEETIDDDKEEINNLKTIAKSQATLIEQLEMSKKQIEETIDDDKEEINNLIKITKNQATLIKQLQKSNEKKDDEEIENLKNKVGKLKEKSKNQESTISSLRLKLKDNSRIFQAKFDALFKNIDLLKKKQQKMTMQQEVKIQQQQEIINQLQERIDQQEETIQQQQEINQKQIDIMNQFEIFRMQMKELNDKLNQKNFEEKNKKETVIASLECSIEKSDDENLNIKPDQIIDREPNPDTNNKKKSTTDLEAEQKAEDESDKEEESKSNSDIEEESSSDPDQKQKAKEEESSSDPELEPDFNEKSNDNYKLIKYFEYESFPTGILDFLNDEVNITAGGNSENVNFIRSVGGSDFKNWINFNPKNENESFIEFDFGIEYRVKLEVYNIQTIKKNDQIYPKSWKIIGSNDQRNWVIIDEKNDEDALKFKFTEYFCCQNHNENNRFRYIRFVQLASWSQSNTKQFYISILFLPFLPCAVVALCR